jgi:predicted DCC family thiol-disulfide oxidoreductase YuxK
MSSGAAVKRSPFSYRRDPNVPDFPDADPVLIFDGECVLCSHSAAFVLRHDRHKRCNFVAAQSELGRSLYRHYGLDDSNFETFVLLQDGIAQFRSDAALRLMSNIGLPWSLAACLRIVPRGLRDLVYNFVARNRYRFFGRRDTCYLPAPEDAGRFLS